VSRLDQTLKNSRHTMMSIAVNHMMLPVYFRSLLPISRRYWSCRDAHLRDHYWSKICLLQSRCVCSWSKRRKHSSMRAGLIIDWQNQLSSLSISKATNVAGRDRVVDRVFFGLQQRVCDATGGGSSCLIAVCIQWQCKENSRL
jgi:hypothetical protein